MNSPSSARNMNVQSNCEMLSVSLKIETQDMAQPDENNNLPLLSACNDSETLSQLDQIRMKALADKHRKLSLIQKLMRCVESNNFEQFRLLLTQKPDLNLMVDGQCLLHFCIMMRKLFSSRKIAFTLNRCLQTIILSNSTSFFSFFFFFVC